MTKAAALFSIGFWSMATVMILMGIAADHRAIAPLPHRSIVPAGSSLQAVSPATAASITYRKGE
jgi:hypothetical protein